MIDKALLIMIFMWTASFSALGVQWMVGDVVGAEMLIQCTDSSEYCESKKGLPMKPELITFVEQGNIQAIGQRASTGNYVNSNGSDFDKALNFSIAAAHVAWDIILLLSGTYIFEFAYFIGIPLIMVGGFFMIYLILLMRAILGYVRGV